MWHTCVIELCIKFGWRNNPILWCTVEKTSNGNYKYFRSHNTRNNNQCCAAGRPLFWEKAPAVLTRTIGNTGHRMYVHFTHASSIWAHPTCLRSHPHRRRSGQAPRTDRCHRRIRRHDKWAGLPGWPRPVATARAVQIPCCRVSLKTSKQNK